MIAFKEILKIDIVLNEDENMVYQNLWHIAKVMPKGKFIELNVYIIKEKKLSNQ